MIIKKIEIKKNNVEVICDDNTSFFISLETYLNNNILIDSEIDNTMIKKLKSDNHRNEAKLELINKISRKKLSKIECELFLLEQGLSDKDIKVVIEGLIKNYLINDKELFEMIVDYCLVNKKGINEIKKRAIDRHLSVDIDTYLTEYLDYDKYKENIQYLINKYLKMGKNKSSVLLKQYVQQKLIQNGYEIDEFSEYLNIKNDNEIDAVKREIIKFFKLKEINNENIAKITKKLLSKGFSYDIIKKAFGECEFNEIN